jgi:hypothetical protein
VPAVLVHVTNEKMVDIIQTHWMTQSTLRDRSASIGNKDVREIVQVPWPMQSIEQVVFISSRKPKSSPSRLR